MNMIGIYKQKTLFSERAEVYRSWSLKKVKFFIVSVQPFRWFIHLKTACMSHASIRIDPQTI